jgi:hypothetical protein
MDSMPITAIEPSSRINPQKAFPRSQNQSKMGVSELVPTPQSTLGINFNKIVWPTYMTNMILQRTGLGGQALLPQTNKQI